MDATLTTELLSGCNINESPSASARGARGGRFCTSSQESFINKDWAKELSVVRR